MGRHRRIGAVLICGGAVIIVYLILPIQFLLFTAAIFFIAAGCLILH